MIKLTRAIGRRFCLKLNQNIRREPKAISSEVTILKFHEFLFLDAASIIDLLDILVGNILKILFSLLLIVFGDLGILLQLLDIVHSITADVADGNLAVFAVLLDLLDQFLTTFLGQHGEHKANDSAVVLGVDAQIGNLNRLLDLLEQRAVPRLNNERSCIGGRDRADLADGSLDAVILDGDAVKNLCICTTGTDCAEIFLQNLQSFVIEV